MLFKDAPILTLDEALLLMDRKMKHGFSPAPARLIEG